MKKTITAVLLILSVLLMTACGSSAPQSPAATPEPTPSHTEEPVSANPYEGMEPKDIAIAMIGQSIEEFYKIAGEPTDSEYTPSCQGTGKGQDGVLFYDGFNVYTLKEADSETIYDVE